MHKKSLISSGIVALLAVAMVAASVGQEKITPVAEADSVTEVPVTEETSQETETVETPEEEAQGNLIVNGDFSDGTNHFNVYTNGGSYNMTRNSEGELQMDITNTGTVNYGVQLYYDGFQLDQGAEYEFSFDVRGSIPRDMEWRIQI
ncbi:MAG: carbohydrate binding domain-containing protein, partial [Lachnospiraceae bacterium]|nr:carbohydrate binding domain-containing protein [Lachnospiraceae bacterium]